MNTLEEDWQSGKSFQLTNLYMLDNELATDITLKMGNDAKPLQAHKFMLISRSQVFYKMFCGQLPEFRNEVYIPDIDSDVMTLFLRYLYTEEIDLTPETVMALMYAAKKYVVNTLVEKCSQYVQKNIDFDNVCTILEQAHLFDEKSLQEKCLTEIYTHSSDVLQSESRDYENLCHKCLKMLLSSGKLYAKEELIYSMCIHWAEKQCEMKNLMLNDANIRSAIGDILYLIRFSNMNEKTFTELVSSRDILTDAEKQEIYQQYSRYPTDSNSGETVPKTQFLTRSRHEHEILRVCRFKEIVGGTFDFWVNDNVYDAISFSCSQDIHIRGIGICSPLADGVLRGCIELFDESSLCLVKIDQLQICNKDNRKTVDIKFKRKVKLKKENWYTIMQQMIGAKSFYGNNGQKHVVGESATFKFRNSPVVTNRTTIDDGQLPEILYTLTLN